ncbi:hypothetical protein ACQUQP_13135 [Marinobacterium sp. YM272]|uniref:hypothetical protein n=1 Tax=Marinobacterium sp. YM272 TaxID=3421654 RepID=UPI003D7F9756
MNIIQALLIGALVLAGIDPAVSAEQENVIPDAAPMDAASQSMELPELPPRDAFDEILQRPLFNTNRRPDATDSQATAVSARELRETWRLTGVFMVGEVQKALLRQRDGEGHRLLTTGMPLDDTWMLNEITPEGVVMDSGDEQVRLDLLEPRDTEPVASMAEPTETEQADSEVRRLDERAREAAEQLQQDLQTTRDERNE